MSNLSTIKILYIDDDAVSLSQKKQLLEASELVHVETTTPKSKISQTVAPDSHHDLYLIDYDLSLEQTDPERTKADYNGTTLSAALREQAIDHPVILISQESLVDLSAKSERLAEFPLIDDLIYKNELTNVQKAKTASAFFVALAGGYREMREVPESERNWSKLLALLQAPEDESEAIARANPPLVINGPQAPWIPARIANWLRRTIIEYPGILYDPVYAATSLRISKDAFLTGEVQFLFKQAQYTGVFAPPEGRWWKHQVRKIAMEYVGDLHFADRFAAVFAERTNIKLEPSVSIVRSESPANAVCAVYHEPVMFHYTLAYRPDDRPAIMEPARISYKAIQQRNDIHLELVEQTDREVLAEIRKMDL